MTKTPKLVLIKISEFISQITGLNFANERLIDLERALINSMEAFGFKDLNIFINWLLENRLEKDQIKKLACNLTIGETFFFRDQKSLKTLKGTIIPQILSEKKGIRKKLKIWSAGCSTGEEPYSIAIYISNLIKENEELDIEIIASDINTKSLEKAKKGQYSNWSFRNTPEWVKNLYFNKVGKNCYEINDLIKNQVKFSYLNLVEDNFPSTLTNTKDIDIIFCRNVLMYFTKAQARKTIEKFYNSLNSNGFLFVSSVETSQDLFSVFTTINLPGITFYKKGNDTFSEDEKLSGDFIYYAWKKDNLVTLNSFSQISEAQTGNLLESSITDSNLKHISPKELEYKNKLKKNQFYQDAYNNAYEMIINGKYTEAEKVLFELYNDLLKPQEDLKLLTNTIVLIIKSYANRNELETAYAWCEKGISFNKLESVFYYLKANILQEKGQLEEAINTLNQVIYIEPDFILAHFVLGNLMLRQGKISESRRYFENSLNLLKKMHYEDIVPYSDEMTSGRLIEIINLINRS